ncbi:Carboxylic ester hydrolase [Tolypocladium paradoxum]|uniref:Carboxylic ester hydrolase n=1 Tax=Tolypocladium paradoxum TaxID=94208 RepID=A0A2S4L603_9HYPO|nr:Carboxylic ester hydrolase [Tolypocladium paradoxum]
MFMVVLLFCFSVVGVLANNACDALPSIDLGYEIHQAISFNETGQYYNFSNIRYGRAPTGNLRFTAPQPPLVNRTAVQLGDAGVSCPQAFAVWYLCGKALQAGTVNSTDECDASLLPPADPSEREDCLFLDIMVPKRVFDNRHAQKSPVMVWFYGGGFAFGKKGGDGNPAGLIERSRLLDPNGHGVIFIQFNYRGGAFGFLSGPNLQANGSANTGLLDQRLLLDWVQEKIHLFGGDARRVTVFGQSAGGGSILHQITAYGGLRGRVPFNQALLQSAGFPLMPGHHQQDGLFQTYLGLLNVSSIEEARRLPFGALQAANVKMVAASPQGAFTWAPTPDGHFVPALPNSLLSQGSYDRSVKVMTGFNAHETLFFTSRANVNNSVFVESLETTFPTAPKNVVNFISESLYPPVFNGSRPYDGFFTRAELALAEAAFTCNTYYLQKALLGYASTFGYRFSIPPAVHGQDVPYTFYNGPSESVSNDTIALALQNYILSFAINGQPNNNASTRMPIYGEENFILDLNVTGISIIGDPNANDRCSWWQKSLYY